MKRCINCLAECNDNEKVCPHCGFDGKEQKNFEHSLPVGTKLGGRYVLGGAFSRAKSFLVYYALDTQTRQRVKIYEYLPPKLMYRLPDEVIIKYHSEEASARGDKEIAAYYSHFVKLCSVSKISILDFEDCFAENSTMYYVCSVPTGTPLSSVIGNGRMMSFTRAVKLLEPVTDCVRKLEKAGKWHGSITPYAIVTNENKITALTGYSYPPRSIRAPFDAPEKQLGAKHCGAYTDVYAIGAILYEAVTGFLPPSAEQRGQGRGLKFPDTLAESERKIIEKALASDKSERYAGVEELMADINGKKPPKKQKPKAEKKKLSNSEIIRRIVLAAASVTFVASAAFLLNYYIIEPYKSSKQSSELVSMTATTLPGRDPWVDIKAKYPDIEFPSGMNPAYADLYALNSDFAGWISIPEMNIDSYVVQTTDNKYYERRDFYGKSTNYGVPFFDYRNTLQSLDRNTIIYGHNMRHDDKIFGTLEQYRDIEGFKKAPFITMNTLYGEYKFKIYAVFISNSKASDDNGHVFNYIFTAAGNSQFANYIAEIDKRKLYSTGVDINENDKIITLSTCCYDFEDARLVVVGRLLRDGESASVDISLPVMNENPKYPQAYYDKQGIENPYADDPDLFE